MLTRDVVIKAVPANLKGAVTQSFVDMVNTVAQDPDMAEKIRDNFISYTGVLKDGRFKMTDYLNAVVYVSHKLMGDSNMDAFVRTFPMRYQDWLSRGVSAKDQATYVSAYSKNKLVCLIMEQTMVPTWVLNHDMFQAALNVQFNLMTDVDVSPKVRSDAANSLLTHLAKPKEVGPLVNFNMNESSGMNELKETMQKLAEQQRKLIESGVGVKQIAAQDIITLEARDVN